VPTGVDEVTWRRAERAAGKDAPTKLVTYIYQRMTGESTEKSETEKLVGGEGDGLSPADVDAEQLAMGVRHEMEHTNDEAIAQEIALDHLAEDPKYYTKLKLVVKSQSFDPPQAVRNNAKRGLELRQKHGRGGLDTKQASEQGIGSGVQRASDLASGDSVSLRTVKRMHAFFSRHEKNKDSREPDGSPGAGMIAWLLWGGDAGRQWAAGVVSRMEKARLPAGARFGMTIPGVTASEHVPGQIPDLADQQKEQEPEPQFVVRTDVPASPRDVAKGVVEDNLANRVATVITRAARTATHELEFRRSISAWISDQGEALTRKQGRVIQARSARWWRKEAAGGNLRSVNQSREQARRVGNWADNPKFMFKGAPRGVPRIQVPHKLPLRGRELPAKTAVSTRRALPAGSVRVHRSTSRGGFVRAEKQPDGTWKILGKVETPKKHEEHKNGVPHLPAHKEHKDSPEHHETPHHGSGASHEWSWK
jgi:hypothetical protein